MSCFITGPTRVSGRAFKLNVRLTGGDRYTLMVKNSF